MKHPRQRYPWPRLFFWLHALGVAGFYLFLWWRTRPEQTQLALAPQALPEQSAPHISLIVPARNEERNIRRCVTSLLEQDYPAYDVLVVDDDSDDGTACILAEVASTHPRGALLRVLHLHELPDGWAGKPHALHSGAQESQGDYLLFTDADTWHAPAALRTAVARAEQRHLDLLSLGTTQELPGFWEQVMMPLAYLGISMQYPPKLVNDPRSPVALANGQYILLKRAVYTQLGGYARADLRHTLLDDRDLAVLVKQAGLRLEMLDGRGLVRVRMYRGLRETWRGWRKNVFLGSRGGLPFVLLQLLGLPMVTILPFLLPLWLWLAHYWELRSRRRTRGAALHPTEKDARSYQTPKADAVLVDRRNVVQSGEAAMLSLLELGPLLAYRRWIDRELRVPWYIRLTHPLAGLIFTGLLAQSTWRVLTRRGVDWRGRHYYKGESR